MVVILLWKGAYVVLVVLIGLDESSVFYGWYSRSRAFTATPAEHACLGVFHLHSNYPLGSSTAGGVCFSLSSFVRVGDLSLLGISSSTSV